MKHKDAFWKRKQKKKEQNHISNIKFWTTQIFFRWGLKADIKISLLDIRGDST